MSDIITSSKLVIILTSTKLALIIYMLVMHMIVINNLHWSEFWYYFLLDIHLMRNIILHQVGLEYLLYIYINKYYNIHHLTGRNPA